MVNLLDYCLDFFELDQAFSVVAQVKKVFEPEYNSSLDEVYIKTIQLLNTFLVYFMDFQGEVSIVKEYLSNLLQIHESVLSNQ